MRNQKKWISVTSVSEHEEMNPSHRHTMEDAHLAIDNFADVEGQGLFAVFDGHGGRGIVDFLESNFERILQVELEHDNGRRSVNECLTSAFLIADIESSNQGLHVSGSTAVACIIRREAEGRVLYSANVGDTRAVLCRKGAAYRLTVDHKASDAIETKRVEEAGGFVLRKRVLGILSVSRSFGDHAMKQYVIARPYTSTIRLEDFDQFLVIACDGVWDVLSDQDVVDFVKKTMATNPDPDIVAKLLVKEALEQGSTDNVTALVIKLN